MKTPMLRAVLPLGLVILTLHAESARGGESGPPMWNASAAAKYLDGRAKWWLEWPSAARGQQTACISCHTTFPFALARPALGDRLGETQASALETALID